MPLQRPQACALPASGRRGSGRWPSAAWSPWPGAIRPAADPGGPRGPAEHWWQWRVSGPRGRHQTAFDVGLKEACCFKKTAVAVPWRIFCSNFGHPCLAAGGGMRGAVGWARNICVSPASRRRPISCSSGSSELSNKSAQEVEGEAKPKGLSQKNKLKTENERSLFRVCRTSSNRFAPCKKGQGPKGKYSPRKETFGLPRCPRAGGRRSSPRSRRRCRSSANAGVPPCPFFGTSKRGRAAQWNPLANDANDDSLVMRKSSPWHGGQPGWQAKRKLSWDLPNPWHSIRHLNTLVRRQ